MTAESAKRRLVINGQKLSIEGFFWDCLETIAQETGTTALELVGWINVNMNESNNLSSAIRLYVLDHVREQSLRQNNDSLRATDAGIDVSPRFTMH
jgi:predicted DNA-binding ribbon-helix-helix protein